MIFYDNAFGCVSHTSVYRIHQHLDFFMQERKGEKLPYSFKIFPVPGMIRDCWSAQPQLWSCQGEKESLFSLRAMKLSSLRQWPSFIKEQS
jgi:hypothetical protein